MKKYSSIFILLFVIFLSCSESKEGLQQQIESISQEMQAEDFPSKENMEKIIALYDQYVKAFPEDEKVLSYLELKAKYQGANAQYLEAIASYDELLAKFPNDERAADALFMQAFIFENNLRELDKAEEKYSSFLQKYPNHDLADDAQFTLDNLYLSDEEIFLKITQMQAENADSLQTDSL